jgi:hypothetical protein
MDQLWRAVGCGPASTETQLRALRDEIHFQ